MKIFIGPATTPVATTLPAGDGPSDRERRMRKRFAGAARRERRDAFPTSQEAPCRTDPKTRRSPA